MSTIIESATLFQSTLPQGERRTVDINSLKLREFQSTLPQGERQETTTFEQRSDTISIHAPTRGATEVFDFNYSGLTISIHAPTRGATRQEVAHLIPSTFQSTLPQGERLRDSSLSEIQSDFNPRSHKGSDSIIV